MAATGRAHRFRFSPFLSQTCVPEQSLTRTFFQAPISTEYSTIFSFWCIYFIYGLFNDASSISHYTAWNGTMILNDTWERTWKQAIVVYSEVLLRAFAWWKWGKPTKIASQDSRDSNRALPEYNSEALPLQPTHSVFLFSVITNTFVLLHTSLRFYVRNMIQGGRGNCVQAVMSLSIPFKLQEIGWNTWHYCNFSLSAKPY
jgi:hypothetical protein